MLFLMTTLILNELVNSTTCACLRLLDIMNRDDIRATRVGQELVKVMSVHSLIP